MTLFIKFYSAQKMLEDTEFMFTLVERPYCTADVVRKSKIAIKYRVDDRAAIFSMLNDRDVIIRVNIDQSKMNQRYSMKNSSKTTI